MSVNVIMPKLDPVMKAGKVTRWFKQEGDSVENGEDLFEMATGKMTQIVKSPAGGIASQIFIQEGKTVPVKVVVAHLSKP